MNFADVLQDHSVHFETEGIYCRPGWIQFHCPFCAGGKDPNKLYCGYNLHYNYINCWRCGKHSVGETLRQLTDLPWHEIKKISSEFIPERRSEVVKTGKLKLPKHVHGLSKLHKDYLRGRGFDPAEIVRLWGIGGIGFAPKLAYRIFIPFVYKGETVSWTTRACDDETKARYISARPDEEAISLKRLIYGEDYCCHTIIIVEGPLDTWNVGPGAGGLLGTGYSRAQVRRLSRFTRRVVCFDNNKTAQDKAEELCDLLEPFPGETYNVVLDAADPGSASQKEIRKLRKQFLGAFA